MIIEQLNIFVRLMIWENDYNISDNIYKQNHILVHVYNPNSVFKTSTNT